jgi:GNAT superfamily N-acetyltransferase
MIIRKSAKNDLEEIQKITILAFKPYFDSYKKVMGSPMYKAYYPDWREKKRQEIIYIFNSDNHKLFVAEENKKIIGFASYILNKKKPLTAEIGNNAVHPKFQKKGIGSSLYKHLIEELKTIGIKYINVSTIYNEAGKPARMAYEKAGFSKSIQRIDYYMELKNKK